MNWPMHVVFKWLSSLVKNVVFEKIWYYSVNQWMFFWNNFPVRVLFFEDFPVRVESDLLIVIQGCTMIYLWFLFLICYFWQGVEYFFWRASDAAEGRSLSFQQVWAWSEVVSSDEESLKIKLPRVMKACF